MTTTPEDTCITVEVAPGVTKRDPNVYYFRACDEPAPPATTTTVAAPVAPLPVAGVAAGEGAALAGLVLVVGLVLARVGRKHRR